MASQISATEQSAAGTTRAHAKRAKFNCSGTGCIKAYYNRKVLDHHFYHHHQAEAQAESARRERQMAEQASQAEWARRERNLAEQASQARKRLPVRLLRLQPDGELRFTAETCTAATNNGHQTVTYFAADELEAIAQEQDSLAEAQAEWARRERDLAERASQEAEKAESARRERDLAVKAKSKRLQLANEIPSATAYRRNLDAERAKLRRSSESAEETKLRRDKQRIRMAENRSRAKLRHSLESSREKAQRLREVQRQYDKRLPRKFYNYHRR